MQAASAYIAFTVVISRVWLAESCGGLTHIEIAHQAAVYFEGSSSTVNYKKLIEKHDVAFQAGAPYPDAFYSGLCYGGKFHDVSEDTHWVPFMNATINYIHRHYPQPWDESTEKLVAFLFGLVSHQVADVSWHSLGIKQGFLSTMAKLNFHDNYDVAHSVGDFGGDVLNRFALKLDYITKEWYIPVDDLVNIYRDLYGGERISAEIIRGCTALLFITRIAEIAAVGKFYPVVAGESPFLLDMLNSYFLGGMNDMAVWTDITWRKTIYMLEHGTRSCQWKHNPLFINCSRSGDSRSYSPSVGGAEKRVRNGYFIQADLGEYRVSDVHIRRAGRGVILSPAPHIQKFVKTVNKLRRKRRAESAGGTVYPVHKIGSSKACGRFGWDLKTADVNKDGHLDLIVGAPGYGRAGSAQMGAVFVILGTSNGIPHVNLDGDDIITIYGPEKHGSFGQAVVILDVNKDGIQDLVVSAPAVPFTGIKEIPPVQYAGVLYFYLGTGNQSSVFPQEPSFHWDCTVPNCNYGCVLSSGDLNNDGYDDLVTGSPFVMGMTEETAQMGSLDVFFAKERDFRKLGAEVRLNGEKGYEWFGYQVAVRHIQGGHPLLIGGAPQHRQCAEKDCKFSKMDKESVGKLQIWQYPHFLNRSWFLVGKQRFEMLGSSFDVGHPYGKDGGSILLVSSPGADWNDGRLPAITQVGSVSLYNLSADIWPSKPLVTLYGDRRFGRFGQVAQFADVNQDGLDDIIVSAPLRTEDVLQEIHGAEEGRVFIYLSRYGIKQTKPDYTLKLPEEQARLGGRVVVNPMKNKVQILVSASHSSEYARLGGVVCYFEISNSHQ